MNKAVIIIFSCLLIFTSCKKGGNGYIRGHVYETGTDTPIEGVYVKLYRSWHGGNAGQIAVTKTDAKDTIKSPSIRRRYTDIKCQ